MSNTATQQQRQSSIAMLVITFLYRIYMLFIAFPLFLFASGDTTQGNGGRGLPSEYSFFL